MGEINLDLKLKLVLNNNGSITANWSQVTDRNSVTSTSYDVNMYPIGETYMIYNVKKISATSYTSKASLDANKMYEVVVTAYGGGVKISSAGAKILIPSDFYEKQPLAIPQNVVATAKSTSVIISFKEVARATSYDILFDGVIKNTSNNSLEIIGLKPKTSHTYAVRAKNSTKTGEYSTQGVVTTLQQPLGIPTGIAKQSTENSATISWNAVSGATSYDVIFAGVTYNLTGTLRTFTGLSAATNYTFQIRAKNAETSSSYTASASVVTAPKAPTSISAISNEYSITVTWNGVAGASGYTVLFNGIAYNESGTNHIFTGLKENTAYEYQLASKCVDGVSSYSTKKTTKTAPKSPQITSATSTKNSVTLNWGASTGATSYDVLFNGQTYRVNGTSKTITDLNPGEEYSYTVRANNADGSSEYIHSETISTIPNPPEAPDNVLVSAEEDSATVSWDPSAGADGYEVTLNGKVYETTETSIKITGLTTGANYTCSVRAKNKGGTGTATTKTVKMPPSKPKNIQNKATKNSATISWGTVAGATSYDITFNGETYHVTGTSKTISGLSEGTEYKYSVRANNEGGSSFYTEEKTITTIPGTPENIMVDSEGDTATISWNAVKGATGYEVTINGKTYSTTESSKKITGLSPNVSYTCSVKAKNASGTGDSSKVETIQIEQTIPATPQNVTAIATYNTAEISWDAVPGAKSYEILFRGQIYEISGTSKLFTGLVADTQYTYRVRAKNEKGSSAYSAEKVIKTLITPPTTPTNVSATATTNSITVQWNSVSEATMYDVSIDNVIYSSITTQITINNLAPGKLYEYAVCAKNEGGSSPYSKLQMIQTSPILPQVPDMVRATPKAHSVRVDWETVSDATEYILLFQGQNYSLTENTKTFTGLLANTDYTYQVKAVNAAGSSAYSEVKITRTLIETPQNIRVHVTHNSASISWDLVEGATKYDVDFDGNIFNTAVSMVDIKNLLPETTYTFSIQAKNDLVSSEYSELTTIHTLIDIPEIPKNVKATASFNNIILSWDHVNNADSYDVIFDNENHHVIEKSRFRVRVMDVDSEGNVTKRFFGLEPNTEHTYCVRANNKSGSSEYSSIQKTKTKKYKLSGLPSHSSSRKYPNGKIPHMGLEPVNALTGAFLWSYTCLEEQGKDGINFTLMYDSQRDKFSKILGNKWTYSLGYLLYMDDEYAYFSNPYGEVIPFSINKENNTFVMAERGQTVYTMSQNEDDFYCIREIDGKEYIFDRNKVLNKIVENDVIINQFQGNSAGQITQITGKHGGKLSILYTNNHISKVSDKMGNAVNFTYENNNLVTIGNSEGKNLSFIYDETDNLVEIKDYTGKTYLSNQYDIQDRVIMQSTAERGTCYASYNVEEKITTFTDELGVETKYYYDENQNIIQVKCGDNVVSYQYNSDNRLIQEIDALDHVTRMSYDEKGRMNEVIYPDNSSEQVVYNDKNYPVQVKNRDNSINRYTYDEKNHLVAVQDERGYTCSYVYDDADNLVLYTDKNGYVWTYAYDSNQHLQQAVDPEGNIYLYNHDGIGRLLSYRTPTGYQTSYEYSKAGDLLKITDGNGSVIFTYNDNGNKTSITDKRGNIQHFTYNEMGQITCATDFMGNAYQFTYDEKGNLESKTDPLGYTERNTYDMVGNCTAWKDKNDYIYHYSFNAGNQLTEVINPDNTRIGYTYDTMGQVKTVTDSLMNETNFGYDVMGRITTVMNALGNSVYYTYDKAGNLLTKTDESGAVTEYAYDKENRLLKIQTDLGSVHFTYDSLGRVVSVQDIEGYIEESQYDGDGNLVGYSDKGNNKTLYVYNESGYLKEKKDPAGNKTSYEYDNNGNCTKVTDAMNNSYTYTYDENNRVTKEINPLGFCTLYEYNKRGELLSVTDANGGKIILSYDGNGNIINETNPLGGIKEYQYDSLNRITKITDEENHSCTYTYDANGNMLSYTDAEQNQWEYRYDALNQLTSITSQDGGVLNLEYTNTGKVAKIVDQEGAETKYRYDTSGRMTEMSDALDNKLTFTYDSQGRILTKTDANGNMIQYKYTATGHLQSVTDPEGNKISYTYNALGQRITETNPLGGIKTYEYDVLGQVISIQDSLGGKTCFSYTSNGKIATVTDAKGAVTEYEYDACGNLCQVTDALENVTLYEYDVMNNRIKECISESGEQACITLYQYDKKGQCIKEINPHLDEKSYVFDGNGNVIQIVDEDACRTVISYDLNRNPVNMNYSDGKTALFRYNKRGELVELTDWNGTTAMEYSAVGKLTKVTDHNGKNTGYSYDGNGNVTAISYPDNTTVNYAFDKNNRIKKVIDAEGEATEYHYDAAGNVLNISQPRNVTTYSYNTKGLPTKVSYQMDDGTTMEDVFTYDALGKITASTKDGNVSEIVGNTAYTYDALGRIQSVKKDLKTESYEYDILGNRVKKLVDGVPKASCLYNDLNQLVSRTEDGIHYTYDYDKRGNLIEEKYEDAIVRQYVYDATGHMVKGRNLESGEKTEYDYNALYMRVRNVQTRKNQSGSATAFSAREVDYVSDYVRGTGNDLLVCEKGYGEVRTVYGLGYEPLSQKITGYPECEQTARSVIAASIIEKSYLQSTPAGSVLFASDRQGKVLRHAEREIWGNLEIPVQEDINTAGIEESLRYTTYRYDGIIQKQFAHARFYDAEQGRMLSKDPVKRGLNPYPYCSNDPVNYVDPTGEIANILAGGALGGLVGGAAGFIGSGISQISSGEKFDMKKAAGSAVNGAVVGAVRGALVGSGVGVIGALGANFAAGVAGDALEQSIGSGKVDMGRSVTSGLTNAVSSAIYGTNPLNSVKEAIGRGAGAGAATAAINNLSDAWRNRGNHDTKPHVLTGTGSNYLPGTRQDPKTCNIRSPFNGNIGYNGGKGYQYEVKGSNEKTGFSLGDFCKDVLVGTVMGGLSSAAFYGGGKALEKLGNSIKGRSGSVLDNANYAQKTYGTKFSAEGRKIYSELAGEPINSIDDLVNAINNGKVNVLDLPVEYIIRDGNKLILNTRTSQALTQAGVPRSQWNAVDRTGTEVFEEMLSGQLSRNKLTSEGVVSVRPSGGKQ